MVSETQEERAKRAKKQRREDCLYIFFLFCVGLLYVIITGGQSGQTSIVGHPKNASQLAVAVVARRTIKPTTTIGPKGPPPAYKSVNRGWAREYNYTHPNCSCVKIMSTTGFSFSLANTTFPRESTCSSMATDFGPGQFVLSYTYVSGGNTSGQKSRGAWLWTKLIAMREHYPWFVMRVYSDVDLKARTGLCEFVCENHDVFWCDIRDLPRLGNRRSLSPVSWKFLPINDPFVIEFESRVSRVNARDRRALMDFHRSNKTIHIMGDDCKSRISTGTASIVLTQHSMTCKWGAITKELGIQETRDIEHQILQKYNQTKLSGVSQHALADVLFDPIPKYYGKILVHDDKYCHLYFETLCRPFPTE